MFCKSSLWDKVLCLQEMTEGAIFQGCGWCTVCMPLIHFSNAILTFKMVLKGKPKWPHDVVMVEIPTNRMCPSFGSWVLFETFFYLTHPLTILEGMTTSRQDNKTRHFLRPPLGNDINPCNEFWRNSILWDGKFSGWVIWALGVSGSVLDHSFLWGCTRFI